MSKLSIVIPLGKKWEFSSVDSIKKQRVRIETIVQVGNNPSRNRNLGVGKAKGELVAFINGHTILADDWADRVIDFFKKNKSVDIVGGPQMTSSEERGIARVSGYALSSKFGTYKVANRYAGKELIGDADETMLTSANLICRKRVFKKVRFDESIYPGEDPKFISDAKKAGFKIAYSPEMRVWNKRRNSLGDLAKQVFNYGKTRPEKESLKETLKMPFFIIPSIFVLYLLAVVLILLASPRFEVHSLIFFPLAIYVVMNLLVSIVISFTNKDYIGIILLPIIFLIIHLSYGIGFLISTIKKVFIK